MDKAEAELKHGFTLYQGGVVPGNSLRVVDIAGVDTEACCGTHADNTAEVGWIRLIKSSRISDGIVRLEYVAQERAIEVLNHEAGILNNLCDTWGVDQSQIEGTASRFFNEYKRLGTQTKKQDQQILSLQVKLLLNSEDNCFYVRSEQADPTLYISFLPEFAEQFKEKKKGICFIGSGFICGLLGDPTVLVIDDLKKKAEELSSKPIKAMNKNNVTFKFKDKKKKPVNAKDVCQFMVTGADFNIEKLVEDFEHWNFKEME
jgi:alanyl-tRNA synthetase